METLKNVLLVLHIAGFAGIIGGVMMQMPKVKEGAAKINGAILHSSLLQLVTGLALVGMAYGMGNGDFVNNAKIGVKTVVVIAIVVIALVFKKKQNVSAGVSGAIGGLALLNMVIAIMWH